jgi:hypothetical protein
MLRGDIADLLETIHEKKEYDVKYAADIKECESITTILENISEAGNCILRVEESLGQNDVMLTCKTLQAMSTALGHLPTESTQIGSGAVCAVLKNEAKLLYSRFIAKLHTALFDAVHVDRGTITARKNRTCGQVGDSSATVIHLADIWTSFLLVADSCESVVLGIVNRVWSEVILPLWKVKKNALPRTSITPDLSELVFDSISSSAAESSTDTCGVASSSNRAEGRVDNGEILLTMNALPILC